MKKFLKIDFRLFVALFACLVLSALFVAVMWRYPDTKIEEMMYTSFLGQEEKLQLKSDVVVVTVPSADDDSLSDTEKNKLESRQMRAIQYLIEETFSEAKGVYMLDTQLLSQASYERKFLSDFREAGNVFWHYNTRNVGYYHEDDKCGQIKFADKYYGADNCFEVFGEGVYDKNYLPYFLMTMDGSTVEYDEKQQEYHIQDKSGLTRTLYAEEDGTVRVHSTSKYNVKYASLDDFYKTELRADNAERYKDAIIFIQSSKLLSGYVDGGDSTQDLADYYIDVLGTIQNEAAIPTLSKTGKMVLVLVGIFAVGAAIVLLPLLMGTFVYVLVMLLTILVNLLLVERNIFYVPLFEFWVALTVTFLVLLCLKRILNRLNAKNLPIDAVIRFTNTIVNIEHSVSYSEYLMRNRTEIEEDISASLLLPVMDSESFLLKELASENHRNKKFVEREFWTGDGQERGTSVIQVRSKLFPGQKYIAFVPLPVFDVESEKITYTVIGLKRKLKPQRASYISMMLFSMYIYFKAQHERGEHQRMYFSMLSLMISVIDAKDPVTAGHSQRVASIAKDIGIWLNLSKGEQFDLEFTALLHDIGKIGVSDYVLNKQSVYTQNDFEQMKYHTIRGAEMLSEVGISEEIIDGVRHHHERIDGKGYPDGLKGDQLSLFAKIIKIADVFDALTSKRQYKDAWEIEKALNIIYRGRGTEFDWEIANVFIEHMSPPGWIPPVDEKTAGEKRNPNTEKAARIVRDFYGKYEQYLSVEYPIPSKKAAEVDFFRSNGFMQYDWGETFNNSAFLEEKPMILAYEKETKSLIFGQCSKEEGVHSIYYYFFKGFVNMGVYLLKLSKTKEILHKLREGFGEPVIIDEQMMVYETRKMRIVFYHTLEDKCLLFYISDYMCANYILDKAGEK
jgi:putative nucleotidyltransferase with HDIG domain